MPTTTYQIRLRDEIINLSDLDISLTIQVRNPTITKPARDGEILPHYYDKYNESIYIVEFSAPEKYKMGTFRIYAKPGAILYWELEELKHKYYPFKLGLTEDIYLDLDFKIQSSLYTNKKVDIRNKNLLISETDTGIKLRCNKEIIKELKEFYLIS